MGATTRTDRRVSVPIWKVSRIAQVVSLSHSRNKIDIQLCARRF